MAELSQLATRAALLKWARDRIDEQYAATKDVLDAELDATDRKAASLGGDRLGYVCKTSGRTTVQVTDEAALTEWVRLRHPGEIVATVRPSYVHKLKADAKHYGAAVDASTGEIVPGLEVVSGSPYITIKLDDRADALIAEHWADVVRQIPELPV